MVGTIRIENTSLLNTEIERKNKFLFVTFLHVCHLSTRLS